ncbi:GntR family transcriptional regulator [Aliiglaciecola sp. M165]|uniref:GntR family transcriptional regulator n=1 Tax=Aliiglaciecola sp. M165 TaxID=2593649 RepID=UPI00117F9457|nr:GntR family transcriptional regulator [Aliiglaciecola sp. M165]TRY32042.1 GntR family transcriptional regulator [Aliiglaciecola sp. M165]
MNENRFDNKLSGRNLAFQPLYKQVEEHVTQLIVEQRWKPGDVLPNEFQLASEFGVSQGTMRKALNALTDAKILTRKQGVGTFVSEHTGHSSLYRFFPLIGDGKKPELPHAQLDDIQVIDASEEIKQALELSDESPKKVIQLKRRRILDDVFCILETIYLPQNLFSGIETLKEIPHTLYHFYQTDFGMTVHKTSDSIKAVLATEDCAKRLDMKAGEPLLRVTRVAHSLDGKAMEYRVSLCRTDNYHYLVNLD